MLLKYDVRDHGVDHGQYFQGAGVAFTDFDVCYLGAADSAYDAGDDALDQLASSGHKIDDETLDAIQNELEQLSKKDDAHTGCEDAQVCKDEACEQADSAHDHNDRHEGCELHHYVSIRVRLEKLAEE